MEEDSDPQYGGWFLEEMLDSSLGSRRDGTIGETNEVIAAEVDEELRRRKEFAGRQPGVGSMSFYVFDPATNRYSSYRVFGVPQSGFGPAE